MMPGALHASRLEASSCCDCWRADGPRTPTPILPAPARPAPGAHPFSQVVASGMIVAVMFPPAGTLVLLTFKSTVGIAGVT